MRVDPRVSIENPDPKPTLTLGTLAELPKIRAHENGTDFLWRVFSAMYFELQEAFPDEFQDDERLQADFATLRDQWQETLDESEPQRLFWEVAQRLRELDWSALETTARFAIVAVPDDVGDEIKEYVLATMSTQETEVLLALA